MLYLLAESDEVQDPWPSLCSAAVLGLLVEGPTSVSGGAEL